MSLSRVRKVPSSLVLKLLREDAQERLAAAGLRIEAVRAITQPFDADTARKLPPTPSVVVRLYPARPDARLAFHGASIQFAEAIVPEEGEPLEELLWQGAHHAYAQIATVLGAGRQ